MNFIGNIDSVNNGRISGWFADPSNYERPLTLEVSINGIHCARKIASIYRGDVKAAGHGNGNHGFSIDLGHWVDFPGEYVIDICCARSKAHLPGSPLRFQSVGQYSLSTKQLAISQQPLPPGVFMSIAEAKKIGRAEVFRQISATLADGREVVVLPPFIDWNIALFQRPQHVAKAMAAQGVLVIYCTVGHHDTSDGFYELEPNLIWTNQFDAIEEDLSGVWFELYSTNPFPNANKLTLWRKNGNKLMYEYVDHLDETISGSYTPRLFENFNALNNELIDLFVATAQNLYEELVDRFGENKVVLAPNGVDVQHFSHQPPMGEKIRAIVEEGKPILGYFGALAPWLDYDLIIELAQHRPDINFVFIGPEYDLKRPLPNAKNLHWLGKIDYTELPQYGHYFDVCFIPFKEGRIAETTSPLKLFEYFALQKPVVVTSWMLECTAFNEVFHGKNVAEVSEMINASLIIAKNANFRKKLIDLANKNSWHNRSKIMIEGMRLPPISTPEISIQLNRGVVLSTGSFEEPYRSIKGICIPDNKKSALEIGFGQNNLQQGDYISATINIADDLPSYSVKIILGAPPNNPVSESLAKYQLFCNGNLVLECPLTTSPDDHHIKIYSSDPILQLEARIVILKTIEESWLAGEAWRLKLRSCVLTNIEPYSDIVVECSTPQARVIRKHSSCKKK